MIVRWGPRATGWFERSNHEGRFQWFLPLLNGLQQNVLQRSSNFWIENCSSKNPKFPQTIVRKNCINIQSDFLPSRVWILMLQTEFNGYILLLLDGYTVSGSINNDKVDCNWSLMTCSNPRYWDVSKVYNSNIPCGQQLIKTQGTVHHLLIMMYNPFLACIIA